MNYFRAEANKPKFAGCELGFRPFFLMGSVFSIVALLVWIFLLKNAIYWHSTHGNMIWWHGHEMIFGFTAAIIAGFLLTAVANWTNKPATSGTPLAVLSIIWLLPRILLVNQQWVSIDKIMIIDCLFLPCVAFFVAKPIIQVKMWKNLMFVFILVGLAGLNALSYYGVIQNNIRLSNTSLHAAIFLIVLIISILGGRVIPFFTEKGTQHLGEGAFIKPPTKIWLEAASAISILLFIVSVFFYHTLIIRFMAGFAGLFLFLRWFNFGWQYSFKNPLVWSLHMSFLCIPVGFGLIAMNIFFSAALHCITIGGIGGMVLSMMARISLGHTGRKMVAPKWMFIAFITLICSALLRVIAIYIPQIYLAFIGISILFWILGFGVFIMYYGKILLLERD